MPADPIARMERGLKITGWLWGIGVGVTALIVVVLVAGNIAGRDRIQLEKVVFTAWTLGPPCWLMLQHYLWPPAPAGLDRFRTHQALVKAVWAGVAAFLAAIMFGRWA